MKPIRIGLLGLGTVGRGTYEVLRRNQHEIARRAGRGIEVAAITVRDVDKARAIVGSNVPVSSNFNDVIRNPDIDIVVELIGGYEPAFAVALEAITRGKHVVTANKALLARHGNQLFDAARSHGVMIAFEAAVAGGIPIIKALREGLTANRIEWIAGIINGTSNFILSEMRARGIAFGTALEEAQRLGYAEADPTFDVEGIDAAHKLAILSSIALACRSTSMPRTPKASLIWPRRHQICRAAGIASSCLAYEAHRGGHRSSSSSDAGAAQRLIANVEGARRVLIKGDAVGTRFTTARVAGRNRPPFGRDRRPGDVTRLHTADPKTTCRIALSAEGRRFAAVLSVDDTVTSYYFSHGVADTTRCARRHHPQSGRLAHSMMRYFSASRPRVRIRPTSSC